MKDTIVRGEYQTELPTKNGIADQSNIDFIKQTVLFNAIRDKFNVVKAVVGYPENDKSVVMFDTEFVIMDINRYKSLVNYSEKNRKNKLK